MTYKNLTTLCFAAVLTLGLAACGGGGDSAMTPQPPITPCDPPSRACIDALQAELDGLGDDATVAQVNEARAALAAAQAALNAVNAAAERADLVAAAMCTAGTAECVAAHEALVVALVADDTTTVTALEEAQANLSAVQTAKAAADAAQMAADALQALADTAAACTAGTQACVDANQAYVDALEADDSTSADDLAAARAALSGVQMAKADADATAARQALVTAAACTDPTQACVDAHQALVDALEADDTTLASELAEAEGNLATVQMAKAEADADRTANEERAALVAAAACTDPTQACVDAHQALVDALEADDTTLASELAEAEGNLATVQMAKAEADAEAARVAADNKAVTDAITAATTAIAALTDESSADDVQAARDLVEAAQTALDGVMNLSADQVASLQTMIDGIDTSDLETHETRIAEAAEEERIAAEAARVAAATKAAGTKRTAISAEAGQGAVDNPDAGLGGSARDNADTAQDAVDDDPYTLAISRKRGEAATIEVTDPAAMGEDDPKFTMNDMGMLVRTMKADDDGNVVQEVVTVSTDIQEPRGVAFEKVAGQALNVDLAPTVDADNDGTANNDLTALAVGADLTTAPDETVRGLVKSDAFAPGSGTSTVLTFARFQEDSDTDTPGAQTIQAYTTPGTYNGAMGTYRCSNASDDCTATVNDKGAITAMSAGWAFIPNEGVTSDVPDADYLHYGFWLQRTTDEDGVLEYDEVETFAGSSVAASGDVTQVTGSATYEGGATGVYVHDVVNPDGTTASATSGHFSADASLTAHFSQTVDDADTPADEAGQIAPALLNTLSGTINNFQLSGHDTGPGWSVALQGDITEGDGTASGTAMGGMGMGSFNATFHGPAAHDHDDDTTTAEVPIAPGSVVGEFNAGFSNGSVAGAFGARKEN